MPVSLRKKRLCRVTVKILHIKNKKVDALKTRPGGAEKMECFVLLSPLQSILSCSIFWAFRLWVSNWCEIPSFWNSGKVALVSVCWHKVTKREMNAKFFFNKEHVDKLVGSTPAWQLFILLFFLIPLGLRLALRSASGSVKRTDVCCVTACGGHFLTLQSEPTLGYFWIGN